MVTKPNWMAPFHIARAMPFLDVQADRARVLRPIASDGHDSVPLQACWLARCGFVYRGRCSRSIGAPTPVRGATYRAPTPRLLGDDEGVELDPPACAAV